jgi:signal recognition particle subunit SRP54
VGEKPDAFEAFHPDRITGRILGQGDMLSLLEKADSVLDRKKSEDFAKKALLGDGFTLEDFRDQLRQIKKLGSMESILKMLPSNGMFAGLQQASKNVDESQFTRLEVIIDSMTKKERMNADIINGSRRKRIATGAGVDVSDVNALLRQYSQMSKMFKQFGKGGMAKQMMRGGMAGLMGGGPKQKFGR